jgi:hypothetical protein
MNEDEHNDGPITEIADLRTALAFIDAVKKW